MNCLIKQSNALFVTNILRIIRLLFRWLDSARELELPLSIGSDLAHKMRRAEFNSAALDFGFELREI